MVGTEISSSLSEANVHEVKVNTGGPENFHDGKRLISCWWKCCTDVSCTTKYSQIQVK